MAEGLEIPPRVRVTSPTFTLINDYEGGRLPLSHADLYRIEREIELCELGLDDRAGGDGVVAVEWSDRFDVLPGDHLELRFAVTGDQTRAITATPHGPRSTRLLQAWVRESRSAVC